LFFRLVGTQWTVLDRAAILCLFEPQTFPNVQAFYCLVCLMTELSCLSLGMLILLRQEGRWVTPCRPERGAGGERMLLLWQTSTVLRSTSRASTMRSCAYQMSCIWLTIVASRLKLLNVLKTETSVRLCKTGPVDPKRSNCSLTSDKPPEIYYPK
jgi:hypothetical protein